ncbi:MAG: InlB B-repeat-containing protein [Planctomycetota bacterium]|jgi:hypothetical protein
MHCIDHNSLLQSFAPNDPNFFGLDPNLEGPGEWRTGDVMKLVVLIGDAPPHDAEPFTDFALDDLVSAANAKQINIVSVSIGADSEMIDAFTDLAQDTDGFTIRAMGVTEVVDAIFAGITFITRTAPPIRVENDCTLRGLDAVGDGWDPNADYHNISEDPYFVSGYYLSHLDAGQDFDSPCIDIGSDLATVLGLHTHTTRTDGVFDAGQVDMGYHYGDGLTRYYLNVTVLPDPCDGLPHGYVDPNSAIIYEGEDNIVTLTAYPDCNLPDYCYRVKEWTGTDDDSSTSTTNTVTMVEDTNVTVQFELPPKYDLTVVVGDHGSVYTTARCTSTRCLSPTMTAR